MKTAIAVAVGAAAALLAAPAAQASPAGYLARIGVDYDFPVLNESEALRAGYGICDKLRQGIPREHVAQAIFWNMDGEVTSDQAAGIAYAAQQELCPETQE